MTYGKDRIFLNIYDAFGFMTAREFYVCFSCTVTKSVVNVKEAGYCK